MSIFTLEEREEFERTIALFLKREGTRVPSHEGLLDPIRRAGNWRALAELGWFAIAIAEADNGLGGGLVDILPLFDGIGRGLWHGPFTESLVVAPYLVSGCGTVATRAPILPRIADGSLRVACAGIAPAQRLQGSCMAERQGQGWRLRGQCRLIPDAEDCDMLLIAAPRGDTGQLGLFGLSLDHPSVRREGYALIDDRRAADVHLDNTPICTGWEVTPSDIGALLVQAEHRAAIAVAADMVGAMAKLNQLTLDYVKMRRQFGVAIGSFQVLQHRLVDMMIAHRRSLAFVKAAAEAADGAATGWMATALACKAAVGRDARFVGEQAIQLHGGIGMTEEYRAGHYFKRLLADDARFGTAAQCIEQLTAGAIAGEAGTHDDR